MSRAKQSAEILDQLEQADDEKTLLLLSDLAAIERRGTADDGEAQFEVLRSEPQIVKSQVRELLIKTPGLNLTGGGSGAGGAAGGIAGVGGRGGGGGGGGNTLSVAEGDGPSNGLPDGTGPTVVRLTGGLVGTPGYKGQQLGEITSRPDLPEGELNPEHARANIVTLSTEDISRVQRELEGRIKSDLAAREFRTDKSAIPLNPYQTLVSQNASDASTLASALRSLPKTELVFLNDISGSTKEAFGPEGARIYDQEAAFTGLGMSGVQNGESSCAVVVFDGSPRLVKPMQTQLDDEVANQAYLECAVAAGSTNIVAGLDLASGQFSADANNKMIVLCTDAQVNNPRDVAAKIAALRRLGIGVALFGFGATQNVKACGGEWAMPVTGLKDAVSKAGSFLAQCLEENNGRFVGANQSAAGGIGVSLSQAPLQAADVGDLGATADILTTVPNKQAPSQVLKAKGDARELFNLADKAKLEAASKEVKRRHKAALATPEFKRALELARVLKTKVEKSGVVESIRKTLEAEVQSEGRLLWKGRQAQGQRLDPDAIPDYVVGLEQGNPPVRIFEARKPTGAAELNVVLKMDESTSANAEKFNVQPRGAHRHEARGEDLQVRGEDHGARRLRRGAPAPLSGRAVRRGRHRAPADVDVVRSRRDRY